MNFLPTLNEFINKNTGNLELRVLIDDFCEFPEGKEQFLLRTQALHRIDDIVMFHRFVMATHASNQKVITPAFEEFNKHHNNMFDELKGNTEALITGRLAFDMLNIREQQIQIECIANESLVINLWATIEQYANRSQKLLIDGESAASSQNWPDIINIFNEKQINIKSFSSYNTIDEMRQLNNKIKHLYYVDKKLAKFDHFKAHFNKSLDSVPFRVQDYTIATYHFICQLINSIGPSERYPDGDDDI